MINIADAFSYKISKIVCLFIQVSMFICLCVFDFDIYSFGNTCLIYILLLLTLNIYIQKRIITLTNITLITYSLLYLMYFILLSSDVNIGNYNGYDLVRIFSKDHVLNVGLFCLKSMLMINMAFCVFFKNSASDGKINTNKKDSVQKASRIIWFCLLPLIIFNDIYKVILTNSMGRNYVLMNGSFIERFDSLFFISAIILILATAQSKKWKPIFAFMILRDIFTMFFTGSRIKALIDICLLLYVYSRYVPHRKVQFKRIVLYTVVVVIIIPILDYIGETRGNLTISFYEYINSNNIYLNFICNIATASLITPCYAMNYVHVYGFLNGVSYLASITTLLPFSNRLFPSLVSYRQIGSILNLFSAYHRTQGGSIFAELYINFGYYSYILSFAFGGLIAYVQNKINGPRNQIVSPVYISQFIYLFYSILILSRSNFYDLVVNIKQIIYFLILWYIVNMFIHKKTYKTEIKDSLI